CFPAPVSERPFCLMSHPSQESAPPPEVPSEGAGTAAVRGALGEGRGGCGAGGGGGPGRHRRAAADRRRVRRAARVGRGGRSARTVRGCASRQATPHAADLLCL